MTAPYSRIYWSVMDDPKFDGIREVPRLFGAWSLLLVIADMAHPAPAYLPPTVPLVSVRGLAAAGLVDLLDGHRYRIHGLDAERGRRSEAARVGGLASGRSRSKEQPLNERSQYPRTELNLAKQSRAETSRADAPATNDPHDAPETPVLQWLAVHGCDIRPGNGYHVQLVTAVERHGSGPMVAILERLAAAGTRRGDVKGYLFGAIDALDAGGRPKLADLARDERAEAEKLAWEKRVARTREEAAALRRTS